MTCPSAKDSSSNGTKKKNVEEEQVLLEDQGDLDSSILNMKAKLRLALLVAVAIFGCVVVFNMVGRGYSDLDHSGNTGGLQLRKLNQPFSWQEDEDDDENEAGHHGDLNKDKGDADPESGDERQNKTGAAGAGTKQHANCRNSVQGKMLIADDKGYVCHRNDILSTGCCNSNSTTATRYACAECNQASRCCKVFESCISCCMNPKKKPVLMGVLNEARSLKNLLLLSASDHFELCLALCRTSSASVRHENVYIDQEYKYCYASRLRSGTTSTGTSDNNNQLQQQQKQP